MPLSEEPNLGKWTIHISADDGDAENEIKANFEVKKYVLPKFEVSINHKKKLKSTDKHVDVKVCGKYAKSVKMWLCVKKIYFLIDY